MESSDGGGVVEQSWYHSLVNPNSGYSRLSRVQSIPDSMMSD